MRAQGINQWIATRAAVGLLALGHACGGRQPARVPENFPQLF